MKHKDQILKLRSEGKSYNDIANILNCSKGTIAFHCGKDQKHKSLQRQRKSKQNRHPFVTKMDTFLSRKKKNLIPDRGVNTKLKKLFKNKIEDFCRIRSMNKQYTPPTFTLEDLINRFGEFPKCYLTGDIIDIMKPRTYNFDHKIPVTKGGDNSIENLGIATKLANMSKSDMTLEECLAHYKKVLENHGYEVKKI